MPRLSLVGDYKYGGAEKDGRKFALIRNGEQLERVREILPGGNPVIWDASMPMTLEVLGILKCENKI